MNAKEEKKFFLGDKVRIRIVNVSNSSHPMHAHGEDFRVIAEDGHPIAEPKVINNLEVGPGKTYDIEFVAQNTGTWVFHCHELHHDSNDGVEPGGLIQVINIK